MRTASLHASSDFGTRALAALHVSADLSGDAVERVPATGALVVVANHPLGPIDGLLLISLISRVRGDVKLLGNSLLRYIPPLRPALLPLDVFSGRRAVRRNATSLRQALRWLEQGGCLIVFPAGEVAHQQGSDGTVFDSAWQATAATLASRTAASVLPIFIEGSNSRLFSVAGRIHPLLRTALLPREMWAMRGRAVGVRFGRPVWPSEYARFTGGHAQTSFLRAKVEELRARGGPAKAGHYGGRHIDAARPSIAARGRVEHMCADINALATETLLESGSFQVFCAPSSRLPAVLPEIGRLRELTFREAGEGTGSPRDLDRFDDTYQHLFVWDRRQQEIAGAYRMAGTDVVARDGCVDGLYTRTLFDYDARLIDQIGPALELGRAFVQPKYQRDFSPLLLLWKGIARAAQSQRYRRLFGVVSISDRYDSTSRQLLVKFLQTRCFDGDLARLVRAKNPPAPPRDGVALGTTVTSLAEVSSMIRRIEPDGKDVPVLLRQYLKLNAKLLGFSVDKNFGNVIDGLVVVDLADVEPRILKRYL